MREEEGRTSRGRIAAAVAVGILVAVTFVAVAVVLDAAELPPFATSSRWAPPLGAVVGAAAGWLVLRGRARGPVAS